jgi:MFS family permease
MVLQSLNMLIMSFVPYSNFGMAIFLSFLSRITAGCGSALFIISSYSILTSDYPDEIGKMVALFEVVTGLGLIMGPIFGSTIYLIGGFTIACLVISIILAAYIPFLYYCVGPSRPYILSNDHISMKAIAMKSVRII